MEKPLNLSFSKYIFNFVIVVLTDLPILGVPGHHHW